jgi:hypothetical protein
MAPIKFEENIKNKLEKRTVMPSVNAWSKLSQQLDAEEKRNRKSSFWWFGIAASVAALVFVSITYFNVDSTQSVSPKMVEENIEELINKTKTNSIDNNQPKEEVAVQAPIIKVEEEVVKGDKSEIIIPKTNLFYTNKSFKTEAIAKIVDEPTVDDTNQNAVVETTLKPISFKDVTEALTLLKTDKSKVSDQQIDSLLNSASKEVLRAKALKKSANVVDANALLQDVEEAMGQSFRTIIYKTLKDGVKKVKTVIVDRNN